jgi:DNA polymerase III subunit alpha
MQSTDFVHLHCHSTYSLLEGLPSPEEIVLRAKELGHNAVGMADKGYTYGLIELYKSAKSQGMKPILGLETYVAVRTRFDKESSIDTKRYPLVLLAETDEGYANILKLASQAALDGMYYKPRVDQELLKLYGKGLIALSGPISGAISQAILGEDLERAATIAREYQSYFGTENFYFELMDLPNVPGQAEVNQQLIELSTALNIPVVATCNSHYCSREDAEAHDVLLCIQKNANVSDTGRFSMRDSDFSMRPFEELQEAFAHIPSALDNTRIIADRCSVNIPFGHYRIPTFPVEQGQTETSLLRELCERGIETRYGLQIEKNPSLRDSLLERLSYELGVIEKMGFSGYFLIVADFVSEAKRRGITVGPGRGSAAGSIVSYVLDITTLDPIEHGLLFERFLNPERISMPDIDIDFADTRRDEVLEYVREKYGHDRVIQICTFGTLAARAAVKDVGRAFGVSFSEMNALAKAISDRPGTTLDEALETDELQGAIKGNELYQKIIAIAQKLEGKARHVSVHACGVVITPESATQYTALQRAPKDDATIITQYDAKPLEALGLLKMDFLGLKNLTIIERALANIKALHDTTIVMATIPTDDKETFALLSRGETTGVFQLESAGMRRYLKQLKPTAFDDITAMVSLYRPGPMDKIPEYIKCKNGEQEVRYPHPDLEPVLRPTYGVGIYQEQILEMARVFAGYSLGEADLLRRAIGKKIKKELDSQREMFINGAVQKGYTQKLAVMLFDDVITPFANYGFNKSHGACYARIAYETAYLKAHYPTAFMAALLSSESGDTDRIAIEIDEARLMNIQVLPPDVNESLADFTALPDGTIRFGLLGIKGVGESSIEQIIALRQRDGKFTSIEDFAKRLPPKILNKKLLESLAKAGALDSLGDRSIFAMQFQKIIDFSKGNSDAGALQTDLFASLQGDDMSRNIHFDVQEPVSQSQQLLWEKETLGLYVSSHPLAGLKKYIGKKAKLIEAITLDDGGRKISVAGILEAMKIIHTKRGETMAIATIEDPTGRIEVTLFPKTYAQYKEMLEKRDVLLVIGGNLEIRSGSAQVRADALKTVSLSTLIQKAQQEGMYYPDEVVTRSTLVLTKKEKEEDDDDLDDAPPPQEPSVEVPTPPSEAESPPPALGPLGTWIAHDMPPQEPLRALGLDDHTLALRASDADRALLSVRTIHLPATAPKELLFAVKALFEQHAGSEKVQLQIGEKTIPVPLTITFSSALEEALRSTITHYVP